MNSVIIASHRRSGTHFLIDAIINNLDCCAGVKYLSLDRLLPWPKNNQQSVDEFRRIYEANEFNVYKTHLVSNFAALELPDEIHNELQKILSASKIIYVYRDGKDVMVSLFNYMKGFREEVARGSFSEFLRGDNLFDRGEFNEMNRVSYWHRHIEDWKESELGRNALFVSYEDLFNDFESTMNKIAEFLEQPLKENLLDVSLKRDKKLGKFERRTRKVFQLLGLTKIKRTSIGFHTGGSGKYKEYFSPEDLEFFDEKIAQSSR